VSNPVLAWHFLPNDHRLASYNGGPRTLIYPGTVVRARGEVEPCHNGLHASIRPLDALRYAPGHVVCRVECSGTIVHADDKLACSVRRVIWMAAIERELHEFACWCAERALKAAKIEDRDNPSWAAIRAKRAWLDGEIDDSELAAARVAAWDAAWGPAGYAAWAAARDTAWDTAWYVANAARKASAWAEQNAELERVLLAIGGSDDPANKPRKRRKNGARK